MMVPGGPRAMRKRKASSITSGYLVNYKAGKDRVTWTFLPVALASVL